MVWPLIFVLLFLSLALDRTYIHLIEEQTNGVAPIINFFVLF